MRHLFSIVCIVCTMISCVSKEKQTISTETNLTQYVDPFIGTAFHGHTYPGATVPFGMIQLSPDNGTSGWDWCSGYHYSDTIIAGFSHLHLSGTGIGDLADISVMPTNKEIATNISKQESLSRISIVVDFHTIMKKQNLVTIKFYLTMIKSTC